MTPVIEFFTAMVLTYSANGEELQSKVLFPSQAACCAAMDTFHETIDASFPGTITQCVVSDIPSKSIRPKARPEEFSNE
jgi:hypothetical protein